MDIEKVKQLVEKKEVSKDILEMQKVLDRIIQMFLVLDSRSATENSFLKQVRAEIKAELKQEGVKIEEEQIDISITNYRLKEIITLQVLLSQLQQQLKEKGVKL